MKPSRLRYQVCYPLWLATFCLLIIGLIAVYSASVGYYKNYMPRQLMWVGIGIAIAIPTAWIHFREYRNLAAPIFVLSVLSLVAVLIFGTERNSAKSWLGFGSLGIQPSELAKIAVILIFGRFLADFEEHRYEWKYYLVSFVLLIIPLFLIILQPDLGTALIFIPVVFAMFFVSGTNKSIMATTFFGGIAGTLAIIPFLGSWRLKRIKLAWTPEEDPFRFGYQAVQSKIAIGSGGFSGRGFLEGLQTKLNFLPERHTDFVYSVIGEEWGLVGCLVVVALYLTLIMSAIFIASRAKDVFGEVVAIGIAVMFATHFLMNIGMTIGLLPVIGVPLPLISYGGSAMLTSLLAIGLLQSIYGRSNS